MTRIYLSIASIFLLAGCNSTPNYCEQNPQAKICDVDSYSLSTYEGLKNFNQLKGKKAFALVQTEDGREAYGYSYQAQSTKKAQKQAIIACQSRARMAKINALCQLIR
ncbi:hypothetical protein [Shewanella gelidii]|uniref:Lipoprotein n=1 Tax=Shewanella gelidii TaxID=1642821 RepID=A0A917JQF1_9GAMM|nr:hypothetical protein [Shewanella gelidii]MCL1097637.1 hypothetical protein [Shewanella gelidii]GGI80042.1 hypothetical protein GCM10009332_16700 [Shewanella gelidii]